MAPRDVQRPQSIQLPRDSCDAHGWQVTSSVRADRDMRDLGCGRCFQAFEKNMTAQKAEDKVNLTATQLNRQLSAML